MRNVVSWSAMIWGHVKCRPGQKALELYQQMQVEGVKPEPVTFMPTWLQNENLKLVTALMRILLAACLIYVSWVLVNMMTKASYYFSKCDRNSGCGCLYNCLPEVLGRLLPTYLHPLLRADEVSAELDTDIYNEGEVLISEWFCNLINGSAIRMFLQL